MPRKSFDPLARIPSPEAVRERLTKAQSLVDKLRILLELSERLRLQLTTADRLPAPESPEAKGGRLNG